MAVSDGGTVGMEGGAAGGTPKLALLSERFTTSCLTSSCLGGGIGSCGPWLPEASVLGGGGVWFRKRCQNWQYFFFV